MAGNTDLEEVLKSMQISCDEIKYGFATIVDSKIINFSEVTGVFQEKEGLTVFAPVEYFEAKKIDFEGPFAKLTIEIHTSLELVGLTAVLATKLSDKGISANVVAAYYHDHIFVQYDARNLAIETLQK